MHKIYTSTVELVFNLTARPKTNVNPACTRKIDDVSINTYVYVHMVGPLPRTLWFAHVFGQHANCINTFVFKPKRFIYTNIMHTHISRYIFC